MAKKLFISYRRKAWASANLLRLELYKHLDAEIFMDLAEDHGVSEIRFSTQILREIASADAFLLIVTEHTFDPDRISDPKDWVVREITEAIEHNIPIILAIWDETKMPPAKMLPEAIHPVTGSQAIRFVPEFFPQATEKLAKFIDKNTDVKLKPASPAQDQSTTQLPVVPPPPAKRNNAPLWAGAVGVILLVGIIAALSSSGLFGAGTSTPRPPIHTAVPETRVALAATDSPTLTATLTHTPLPTLTPTLPAPTRTVTSSSTPTLPPPTLIPTRTLADGEILETLEADETATTVAGWTKTPTLTPTHTPSLTYTPNRTATLNEVRNQTATARQAQTMAQWTKTPTPTSTPTSTYTYTPSKTFTPTYTYTPSQTFTPTPLPAGFQFTDEKGVVMVWVPPGTFMMGSTDADKDASSDEKPQTRITFEKGFWIDRTEVTNKDYKAFINAGGYQQDQWWPKGAVEWKKTRTGPNDYSGFTGDYQPRVGVYGVEAMAYCAWRGGKLPDESEWEYAARGSDGRLYPWGNQAPDASRAVFGLGSSGKTLPVNDEKRLQGASWVGALDMAGNVWEWTASIYGNYPFKADPSFRDKVTRESLLVLRGGSYYQSAAGALRVAVRDGSNFEGYYDGFRCARSS